MIYLLVSLFYLFYYNNKGSISHSLYFFLFLSSAGAFLVGRQHTFDVQTLLFTIYNVVLLCILFNSFSGYSSLRGSVVGDVSSSRLQLVEKITVILGIVVLLVDLFIFYRVFGLLLGGDINVQSHKNEGGAADVFSGLVPHPLMTFSYLFSPFSYLFLSFHFYYLTRGDSKKAIICFVLSLTAVLSGLVALSRSSTVQYVLIYFIIFVFVKPLIHHNIRRKIYLFGGLIALAVGFVFFIISDSRFSSYYTKWSKNDAIIDENDNPLLFSTIDYFSSWQENAPIIMSRYKIGSCYWGLFNSCGLAIQIEKEIYGSQAVNEKWELEQTKALGDQKGAFHGLIARLIYDFGFVGTVLFIFLYSFFIKKNRPKKGLLSFNTLLFLPVLLPASAVFFAGNEFSSLGLDLAIIYSIVISKFVSIKNNKMTPLDGGYSEN